jgi:hypothetical protein
MKILRAAIYFEGENGLHNTDAIERDRQYWLVPHWLGAKPGTKETPVRLVGISKLVHQVMLGSPFGDLIVSTPIPRAVYEGRKPPAAGSPLVVIENEGSSLDLLSA